MFVILTTLIEESNEADKGRFASCLGKHCPYGPECAAALEIEAHGLSTEPPPCPVRLEMLFMLWQIVTEG